MTIFRKPPPSRISSRCMFAVWRSVRRGMDAQSELKKRGNSCRLARPLARNLLYSMAWQNFKEHPGVLIRRLMSASYNFVYNLPDQLFRGYGHVVLESSINMRNFVSLVCVAGLIFLFSKRRERGDLPFWSLSWLSIVASTSLIYFDDGDRALAVSYVIIFLFFALGFANPAAGASSVNEAHRGRLSPFGISCFAITAILFFGIPRLAYLMWPARQLSQPSVRANETVVFGGRRISGFLVVPDGAAPRNDVPTVDLSTFSRIVGQSGIELYQGLVNPQTPKLRSDSYLPPQSIRPEVISVILSRPKSLKGKMLVLGDLTYEEWQRKTNSGPYWFYVTHAEPLQ